MSILKLGYIGTGSATVFAATVFFMMAWANTPVVYITAFTNDCVAILTPEGVVGCESIPVKHATQTVVPGTTFDDVYYWLNH